MFTHDFFPFKGGQGRHVYEMYKQNELSKQINLIVFSPAHNHLENSITLFDRHNRKPINNILFSIRLSLLIENLIDIYKLDLVHIHSGPGGLFLLNSISIPAVVTSHHTYWQQSHYIRSQKWKILLYSLEKHTFSSARQIICVSPDTENIIINNYHVNADKVNIIPNGIRIHSSISSNQLERQDKLLLFVGRIDERKGLRFLIDAFSLVQKTRSDIILHIVGDGKGRDKLAKYCQEHALRVVFHGFLQDRELAQLSTKVTVQVVPSVFEGFGMVVLEAMANKIPVIGTNVDGIRGLIKDGYNGLLVNYGDINTLSDKILQLFNNPDLCLALSTNAALNLRRYNWEDIYSDTLRVYQKALLP
jgi:glycosyltransferase involved in cell wall biosynthesis